MSLRARAVPAALLAIAVPAAAQNGAQWVDPYGRMTTLEFVGGRGAPPPPLDRPAGEMARLFKSLCLDTGGSAAEMGAAARQAAFDAAPFTIPGGKAGDVVLGVWRGEGAVLSQSDGFFAAPNAQCNVSFYVTTVPESASVTEALAAAIGSPPSNLADATDKKGRPKKYYSPEWTIGEGAGARIVTAHVMKGSRTLPASRVQMSVRAAKKAGK
jgi:hypothetical protein